MTLWLWKMLHDTSCLALTMPAALWMAATYGLLGTAALLAAWLPAAPAGSVPPWRSGPTERGPAGLVFTDMPPGRKR